MDEPVALEKRVYRVTLKIPGINESEPVDRVELLCPTRANSAKDRRPLLKHFYVSF